jgi:hypothetical protein
MKNAIVAAIVSSLSIELLQIVTFMAYLLTDTQKLDNLLAIVQEVVLKHGNSDNRIWKALETAMWRLKIDLLPKESLRDVSGALGIPEYVD